MNYYYFFNSIILHLPNSSCFLSQFFGAFLFKTGKNIAHQTKRKLRNNLFIHLKELNAPVFNWSTTYFFYFTHYYIYIYIYIYYIDRMNSLILFHNPSLPSIASFISSGQHLMCESLLVGYY